MAVKSHFPSRVYHKVIFFVDLIVEHVNRVLVPILADFFSYHTYRLLLVSLVQQHLYFVETLVFKVKLFLQ